MRQNTENKTTTTWKATYIQFNNDILTPLQKKNYPVDFDDELKIGDIRYDNMT